MFGDFVRRRTGAIALSLAIAVFAIVHLRSYLLYARIEIGQPAARVIEVLGKPRRRDAEMIFCHDYVPWSGACPEHRPDIEYWFFKFGIARWIVVGIDADGRVSFKTMGDT